MMTNNLPQHLFKPITDVVAQEVDFAGGTATLHFRLLTVPEVQVLRSGLSSHDYDARADLMAWSISRSICNPDGSQVDDEGIMVLSESDAKKLTEEAFLKLFSVVISLNIRRADSAGKSLPTNGGGTPSPSPLADAPLPN